LKVLKPTVWKRQPATLGEILLKYRIEHCHFQCDHQEQFEWDKEIPKLAERPLHSGHEALAKHIAFLGFYLNAEPETLGENLRAYRPNMSWSKGIVA